MGFGGNNLANSPTFGSSNAPFINYNTTIDLTDGVSKVWRSHVFKAGFYMQRSRKDQTSFGAFNGNYNFGDQGGPTGANPLDTGYGYSNALLGVFQSFNQAQHHINGMYRYWNIEQYFQDTWKLTPRLTLDYGLRAAWYQPQYDSSLQASTFILSKWDPAQAPRLYQPAVNPANNTRSAYDPVSKTYLTSNYIGVLIPGSGNTTNGICQAATCINKYLTENQGLQWGPRFGIAWDVTGKQDFVIRTGGGIFYDRIQGNRYFDMVANPPEAFSVTAQYGFAQQLNPATALLSPPAVNAVDPTGKIPTTYSYQFSMQKRLPWSMILDVAYVGSASRHQQDNRNLNWSPFGTTFTAAATDPTAGAGCIGCPAALGTGRPLGSNALPQNFMAPMRGYGNINLYESAATSNYNALQVQAQRRAAKGLFLGVSYTWSKAMANSLSGGTNDNSFVRPDQYNNIANVGPTSFDRRHDTGDQLRLHPSEAGARQRVDETDHQWLAAFRRHHGADRRTVYAFRQRPELIQSGRHRVLYRRVAAGARGRLRPLHALRQLEQLFEPRVFPAGLGWEHRARIQHQLPQRPGRSELRHGAPKGVCRHQGRQSPLPVPRRRVQRLQPHHLHRCQQRVGLHGVSRQQQRRDHWPTDGIHLYCAGSE